MIKRFNEHLSEDEILKRWTGKTSKNVSIETIHNEQEVRDWVQLLEKNMNKVYEEEFSSILCDIHELAEIIHANNIVDKRMRKQHVKGIRTKVNHFKELEKNGICPKCGNALVERNGKYGKFIGCSHYPKCKYIKK